MIDIKKISKGVQLLSQKLIPNVYFPAMTVIDKALLDILVCPVSKKSLSYNEDTNELISQESGLAYPIRDGIPVMLPEEARKI